MNDLKYVNNQSGGIIFPERIILYGRIIFFGSGIFLFNYFFENYFSLEVESSLEK